MIPQWNISGVLPPIRPGQPGHSADRSPYKTTLSSILERFAFSTARCEILKGLLEYRAKLHNAGLVKGFQWLDGSFMEEVEIKEERAPNDIDVVSFFYLPDGMTQATFAAKHPDLFNHGEVKGKYKVDAYPFVMGETFDTHNVQQLTYWYSMWSHTRSELWKGFLEIDLSPELDQDARHALSSLMAGGCQ